MQKDVLEIEVCLKSTSDSDVGSVETERIRAAVALWLRNEFKIMFGHTAIDESFGDYPSWDTLPSGAYHR